MALPGLFWGDFEVFFSGERFTSSGEAVIMKLINDDPVYRSVTNYIPYYMIIS